MDENTGWYVGKIGLTHTYKQALGYSGSIALEWDGFLPGCAHMLAWDIYVRRQNSAEKDIRGYRGFVGYEYTCGNGHRFFSCGKGVICRSGHVSQKENARHVINKDFPLYTTCTCYPQHHVQKKQFSADIFQPTDSDLALELLSSTNVTYAMARLTRVYIITPSDIDFDIQVNPCIRISTETKPFYARFGSSAYSEDFPPSIPPVVLQPNNIHVIHLPTQLTIPGYDNNLFTDIPRDLNGRMQRMAFLRGFIKVVPGEGYEEVDCVVAGKDGLQFAKGDREKRQGRRRRRRSAFLGS